MVNTRNPYKRAPPLKGTKIIGTLSNNGSWFIIADACLRHIK